jgi:thiosulfate/3-mercaptopyruvate sulfurtransferase
MLKGHLRRFTVIAAILALAVVWTVSSAQTQIGFTNQKFVATAAWLQKHLGDPKVVIVDVRADKRFDGKVITGAIRLPWTLMRYNDRAMNIGGAFAGLERAQQILGEHGITRDLEIVLYDDLERDGGATASYLFWILDLLGHEKMRVLEGGIEAWSSAGGELSEEPASREQTVYQAPSNEIVMRRWQDGGFIYDRLGDPYYQVLDVRSQNEYLGETPNAGLDGKVLKLGHIPGAYNRDYRLNWADTGSKLLKSPNELAKLYTGLDPARTVVVYCHSGRRSSYSYYVLRVMGYEDVICYGRSWNEWGSKDRYFPVETQANQLSGRQPRFSSASGTMGSAPGTQGEGAQDGGPTLKQPGSQGGYISCGG